MASGPITSWEIDGETVETVSDFIFLGLKITADGDCSHEIKRRLLLGRRVVTNLDSVLKSRDITLPIKVCLVKVMVLPVVLCGCECWSIKKAECRGIDAFELWCWRRLLRVPWTARRSKQSFLKEVSPGYSLEGLMLKLKLQYFGHLMRRADSLEKTLMLGGIGTRRRRGRQRMRWLDGITNSMGMGLGGLRSWWWTRRPGVLQFMGSQRAGHDWATELNWTWSSLLDQFFFPSRFASGPHTAHAFHLWSLKFSLLFVIINITTIVPRKRIYLINPAISKWFQFYPVFPIIKIKVK